MSVQAISTHQSNNNETNLTEKPADWNGRSVVVADEAYQNKQPVQAGFLEGFLKQMLAIAFVAGIVIAAIVAGIAVSVSTGSIIPALIPFAVIGTLALLGFVAEKIHQYQVSKELDQPQKA